MPGGDMAELAILRAQHSQALGREDVAISQFAEAAKLLSDLEASLSRVEKGTLA